MHVEVYAILCFIKCQKQWWILFALYMYMIWKSFFILWVQCLWVIKEIGDLYSIKKDNSCVLKLLKYWYTKSDFIFDNIHCIILYDHKSISTFEIFTMKSKEKIVSFIQHVPVCSWRVFLNWFYSDMSSFIKYFEYMYFKRSVHSLSSAQAASSSAVVFSWSMDSLQFFRRWVTSCICWSSTQL